MPCTDWRSTCTRHGSASCSAAAAALLQACLLPPAGWAHSQLAVRVRGGSLPDVCWRCCRRRRHRRRVRARGIRLGHAEAPEPGRPRREGGEGACRQPQKEQQRGWPASHSRQPCVWFRPRLLACGAVIWGELPRAGLLPLLLLPVRARRCRFRRASSGSEKPV